MLSSLAMLMQVNRPGPVKQLAIKVTLFLKTGKSTIGGQIMYLTNMVDKRTLEKYEKEAKEINRETWYLSWCMDTNAEERNKGKTVEVSNQKTDMTHSQMLGKFEYTLPAKF